MENDIIWQDHCGVLIPKVIPQHSSKSNNLSYMKQRVMYTAEEIITKAYEKLPQHSSKSNEWRTPMEYIDAVIEVMGVIDLDPASTDEANMFIRAKKYYTKEDSGLNHTWEGHVFMNPPYGNNTGKFVNYFVDHYINSNIVEGIVIVNSNTSTKYWQNALHYCSAICFPSKRIAFLDEEGSPRKSPPHSNSVFYFGRRMTKFKHTFKRFGEVIIRG